MSTQTQKLTVRMDVEAAKALAEYMRELGREHPTKGAVVSSAILYYLLAKRNGKNRAA